MTIEQQIINAALAAVKELYGQEVAEKMVQLQKTKKEFEGNLTLVVFPFLKISRKKPDETAREIGEYRTARLSPTSTLWAASSTSSSTRRRGSDCSAR